MDRKILKYPFTLQRMPEWECPTCQKGHLRIKDGTFFEEEARHSRDHSHDSWEPEWIRKVYSCLLACSNDQCKETLALSGTGSVDTDYEQDEDGGFSQFHTEFYSPKSFQPHLKLFKIPTKCPDPVKEALEESFRLFFSSPGAAANCVRIAIEELLTDLKVKRFDQTKGQRRFIPLHKRISLIPSKYSKLSDMLIAIKWIGNAGSHGNSGWSEIRPDDVLDAYELAEHVLQEIYEPKAPKLIALAKKVNKKKGPRK